MFLARASVELPRASAWAESPANGHAEVLRSGGRRASGRTPGGEILDRSLGRESGAVLAAVMLLWQRTASRVLSVDGPLRWTALLGVALALAGFWWGVASLGHFDPFGVGAIRRHLQGRPEHPPVLTVRGAYRWVRHPLYLFMLVLIWSSLDLTTDWLLFDALWTAWIVVGTILEERDLAAEMGQAYVAYQRRVPMLVPWRRPAAVGAGPATE